MARQTVDEKAKALLEHEDRIEPVDHEDVEAYRIEGSTGKAYFVIVENGKVEACTCPAGQFGTRCYHAAAVEYRIKEK